MRKNFTERLWLIIKKRFDGKWTQLAKKAKISPGSFKRYLDGSAKPGFAQIVRICDASNANPTWLLTGQGEMFMKPTKLEFKHMPTEEILKQFPQAIPAHPVPVINIQVPAGFPEIPLDKEQIIDYLYLPDIPKGSLAIKVRGASMEPTIEDGDYVVFLPINKLTEPIKNGDIIIVRNEWNELILKRYREKEGKAYLTSDNPKYPTIEPNENYKIIGKIIRRVKEERF